MECASHCFKYIDISADFWMFECNCIALTSLSFRFLQKPVLLFILLYTINTSPNFVRVGTYICITQAGYSWGESYVFSSDYHCLQSTKSHALSPRNSRKLFFNLAMVHDKGQIQKKTLKLEIPCYFYIADISKGK